MKFPIKDFFSKCDQFGHIYLRNPEWKASFFMYLQFTFSAQGVLIQFVKKVTNIIQMLLQD